MSPANGEQREDHGLFGELQVRSTPAPGTLTLVGVAVLGILALVALLVAACAPSGGQAPSTAAAGSTINVMSLWGGSEQDSFQKVLDAFKTKTGVTATYESIRQDYATTLQTRIASGKPPDVAIIPGIAIVFSVLGFNLIGDGLREALDPKLILPAHGDPDVIAAGGYSVGIIEATRVYLTALLAGDGRPLDELLKGPFRNGWIHPHPAYEAVHEQNLKAIGSAS